MMLQIPDELLSEDYHIVAFSPLVDRNGVMHHQLLFGCKDGTQASVSAYKRVMFGDNN